MACASCGEQVDRLRSANNARLTFRLRRLLSLRPLSSESGSVSFGHTRCRHQSYADDGLDCRAATSLFMAEVALGLTLGPTAAGGGRSAALAMVTLPTPLRRGRDAGRPGRVRSCGNGSCGACEVRAATSRPRSVGSGLCARPRGHDQGRACGRRPRGEPVPLARLEG
jgi:hypothetical protein